MKIINSWKKLIDQFESDNKAFETEILNSDYSIEDYNYFTINAIVKYIQDKDFYKEVLNILAKGMTNHVLLSIMLDSLYNDNTKLDDYLMKNKFIKLNITIYNELIILGEHFQSSKFWGKIECYLEYFDFYRKINDFLLSDSEHIKLYFLEKLGNIKSTRSQYMLLPYLKGHGKKIAKRAVVSLRGYDDVGTIKALLEVLDNNCGCEKEIRESLSLIAERNYQSIKEILFGQYTPSQKQMILDILSKQDPLLIFEEMIDLFDTIDERLRLYLGKKINIIFEEIIVKKSKIKDVHEKEIFMEQNNNIVSRTLRCFGIEEISFSVLTKFIFEFEDIYIDRISEIFPIWIKKAGSISFL